MEYNEEVDKLRTKILKYVLYKKRTENEVRQKFASEDANMLDETIEYLKEANYINDKEYIEKCVDEFMRLHLLSIKEIQYKLMSKGLSKKLIDDYIYINKEELTNYELESAKKIAIKKSVNMEETEIEQFLQRKGYLKELIKVALDERN